MYLCCYFLITLFSPDTVTPAMATPASVRRKSGTRIISILLSIVLFHACPAASETLLKTAFQESIPKFIENPGRSNHGGICCDIIIELNRRLEDKAVRITFPEGNPFLPWQRTQAYLESGKLDIVVGMAKNRRRLEHYFFSEEPLYTVRSVLARRAGYPFRYRSLTDLKNRLIIAVQGTKTARMLLNIPEIKYTLALSPTTAVQMLLAGRGDLLFYHDLGLAYIIRKNGWSDEVILSRSVEEYDHFVAYSRTVSRPVRHMLDIEIRRMKQDGTMATILNRYR